MNAVLAVHNSRAVAAFAEEGRNALRRGSSPGIQQTRQARLDSLIAPSFLLKSLYAPRLQNDSIALRDMPSESSRFTQRYWSSVIARQATPKQASIYMPIFKEAFTSKGIPSELAWLSEVESSIRLDARSTAGAYGPFQFMPETAKRFGLKVGPIDERTDPRKSAEAAATYLKILHNRFQSWPIALAAYNAGEGRVGRALKKHGAKTFEDVAPHLPKETRMFVPRALATIATRESVDPSSLFALVQVGTTWEVAMVDALPNW